MSEQRREAVKPRASEHIVATEFEGGEGVLVDLNEKKYFQLNETAMLVWRGVEKGKTASEIVGQMIEQYDVASEQAARSVERALENFRAHKLVI